MLAKDTTAVSSFSLGSRRYLYRYKSCLALSWASKMTLHYIGMSADRCEVSNSEQGKWGKVHVTLSFIACQACDNFCLTRICHSDDQRYTIKVKSFGKTDIVLHKCQFRTICSDPFLAPIIMKSGLVLPFPWIITISHLSWNLWSRIWPLV